jgi:hypothetical protein
MELQNVIAEVGNLKLPFIKKKKTNTKVDLKLLQRWIENAMHVKYDITLFDVHEKVKHLHLYSNSSECIALHRTDDETITIELVYKLSSIEFIVDFNTALEVERLTIFRNANCRTIEVVDYHKFATEYWSRFPDADLESPANLFIFCPKVKSVKC